MPIGWNRHDLWPVNGYFGFNTANSDVFGISSAGLANRWVHVSAVFTNGSVTSNKLYIDGVSLNTRMYAKPGQSLSLYAVDGTVTVQSAMLEMGLK